MPNPEKSAAVLGQLKERQKQWREFLKNRDSENRSASTSKFELLRTAKFEAKRAYASGLSERAYTFPGNSAPGMSARFEGDGASGDRHDLVGKRPANYQQTSEEAEQDWIELNCVLTGTSEDAEHQPGKESARERKFTGITCFVRVFYQASRDDRAGFKDRKLFGNGKAKSAGFLTRKFES